MTEPAPNQPTPENRKCPECGTPLPAGTLAGLCPACLLKQGAAHDTAQPDSPPFVPPSLAEISQLFPQLEIISLLGKGGMGAVYKARQPMLDRLVALKILPAHVESDPGFAERFTREARALARLSHPNIVTVHEFGQAGNLHYFIMEFVDGANLRQLQLSGRLSPREALLIVPQLCDALQYAHDAGVVHRDIKPENVLMDRKGRVKIADFGLAKILDQDPAKLRLTGEGHVMGTPHYMSPEQVEHPLDVDHRADIYSLGVVFYEMLTGELPIGRFAPPSRKVQIDVRLDDVVLRTLEKEPDRRYQHASQVKTAVEDIGNTPKQPGPPPNAAAAAALAGEILARDYFLDIGYCLRRGWALVRDDFWPLVGVNALMLALLAVVNSNHITAAFTILVHGPLIAGLYLYFLRKIRREAPTIETAFSGFTQYYLHLFLGTFVRFILLVLGFLCLILPGIYLLVAWSFTLPLIIDKRLDFWSAMELSRKMVTKHWWKFLGFLLVLVLINFVGLLLCVIGFFFTSTITMAALAYAYQDLFSATAPVRAAAAAPAAAGAGPTGTTIIPPAPPRSTFPSSSFGCLKPVLILVTIVVILIISIVSLHTFINWRERRQSWREEFAATNNYWSPTVADDQKIDLSKILQEAKKLTDSGKYEDAHQRYLWYFYHALEYDPAQSAVRLSFELSDWTELSRRYPPARTALNSILDHDTREFYDGRGYFALFMDVNSLNQYLQNEDQTLDLFESFRHNDAHLASQCFPLVESQLVKEHKYKECLEYLPDPQAAFDRIAQSREQMKKFEESAGSRRQQVQKNMDENNEKLRKEHPEWNLPSYTPPEPPKTADNTFVGQTRQLIEILVGTGKQSLAKQIQKQALDSLSDPRLESAVSDAELKIQSHDSVDASGESVDTLPPVVVHTEPASGARDVDPGTSEIKVTFSKEMLDNSWSWCDAWANSSPAKNGEPTYDSDQKTCVLNVTLEPGKTYAYWLNTETLQNFKDTDNHPAVPYLLIFHTSAAPAADRSPDQPNQPNQP